MTGWHPGFRKPAIGCKSVTLSISPEDLKLIDQRAREIGKQRAPALRSLLQELRELKKETT